MKTLDAVGIIRDYNVKYIATLQSKIRYKIYHIFSDELWNHITFSGHHFGRHSHRYRYLFITIQSGLDDKIIECLPYEKKDIKSFYVSQIIF